jgi:hypothetical protein
MRFMTILSPPLGPMLCHTVRFSYPLPSRGTISSFKQEPHTADIQRDLDDSDQAILSTFEDNPFASGRQLSQLTYLPSTTVYHRLTQSLGFVARHLRWVPHALSDAQKGERINLSRRLLQRRMLEVQCGRAWHDIVTLDES